MVLSLSPSEQVTVKTGGQKAFGLRKLTELSSETEDGFLVPTALIVPFGVMERLLSSNQESKAEYRKLARELDSDPNPARGRRAERLCELLETIDVPEEIASALGKKFGAADRLMVRSSANCEDLEEFAGAGLYRSVPNVRSDEVASAIRRVWSSLWTRRAVLSRKQTGIPHEKAQMAVIIQQMLSPDYSFVLHTVNPLVVIMPMKSMPKSPWA